MVCDVVPLTGYREPYGLLLAVLQDGTREWRNELEGDLGPEATTWRARPGGPTIGALMLHTIGVELIWFERVVLGREYQLEDVETLMLREIDVDKCLWPEPPKEPLSWYFALQDRYRARSLEVVKEFPEPDAVIGDPGDTPRWVLGHVIQHEAYHGGQILMMCDLFRNRC